MTIPFTKAHGASNDFLYTWRRDVPLAWTEPDLSRAARAICNRNTGVGADGWYLMNDTPGADVALSLFNSDGSKAELSGNGTRCAAALIAALRDLRKVCVLTGSGPKELVLLEKEGYTFRFEMDMGVPSVAPGNLQFALPLADGHQEVTILDVGNPQCAVVVETLDFDWRALGAAIEGHAHFPKRTNVSFLCPTGPNAIEARFYERGAGPTLSSGTGSTGAAAAAVLRGLVQSPVAVHTEAGVLRFRWENPPSGRVFLDGPAEITAHGGYYWREEEL